MLGKYELRLETVKDYNDVENLTREAFWNKSGMYGALCLAPLSHFA